TPPARPGRVRSRACGVRMRALQPPKACPCRRVSSRRTEVTGNGSGAGCAGPRGHQSIVTWKIVVVAVPELSAAVTVVIGPFQGAEAEPRSPPSASPLVSLRPVPAAAAVAGSALQSTALAATLRVPGT